MRGRTFARASLWIGRPGFVISIVTIAPLPSSPSGSTFETLPTLTPAIRTGERFLRSLTLRNAALTSYGLLNGLSLRKPITTTTTKTIDATRPHVARLRLDAGRLTCRAPSAAAGPTRAGG